VEEDEWLKLHLGVYKTIELKVANLSNVITICAISHNILLNQEEADMELLID
jgi:hypothetical protein